MNKISAQSNIYEIENDIKAELTSKYVSTYSVNALVDVNQELNSYRDFKFPITDPYSTLNDCYIFQADVNSGGLVGIYKNGTIIWDSGPIIEFGEYADVLGTIDLNNNGNVEIVFGLYYGMHNSSQSIWIFSWNGQIGSLSNDTESVDELNKSVIFSYDWHTEIYDVDGDGILEIKGQDEESRVTKIYSWNGVKYGDYGVPVPQYVPMHLLTAEVICQVTLSQHGLIFNYTIKNDSASKQPIGRFSVEKIFDLVYDINAPHKWQGSYSHTWDNLLKWGIISDSRFYPYNFIQPSNHLDSISFVCDSILPYITSYYIQGKNGDSFPDDQYIFENSFKGKTISGKNPPDPFIPIDFLDSLLNYNTQSFELGWITNQTTTDKYDSLFNLAKSQLQQNNNTGAKAILQTVLQEVDIDSTDYLTSEAYALVRYNTEYLLDNIPQSSPNLLVNLKNSLGNQIPASNVKYYDTSWKDAVDNGDGTFTVITTKPTVSIRVFYEYANQTVNNVPAQNNTYTFTTVNAAVQLKNSLGNLIDQGTVQYYAGAWRSFGTTSNGVANKELLPINYSFRMTYEFGSIDKQQNLSVDPTVVFQTVNAVVQLKNSLGNLIDQGTVQYYAGAWRSFGTTSNGVANKELLPVNYSFRMTHEFVSIDKQQNLSANPVVEFSTVLCSVRVSRTSNNQPINNAAVKYYSVAWRDIGQTNAEGIVTKELLPKNLSFRAISGSVSQDKQQDIGVNSMVEIQLNTQ